MLLFPGLLAPLFLCMEVRADKVCPPSEQSPKAASRLLQNLFCDYHSEESPNKPNLNMPTQITVRLRDIIMFEEMNLLQIEAQLFTHWEDQRLKWSPADYDGLIVSRPKSHEFWRPKIYVGDKEFSDPEASCVLNYFGIVTCIPSASLRIPCDQDLRLWPFDEHKCQMELTSTNGWGTSLNATTFKIDTEDMIQLGPWSIVSASSRLGQYTFIDTPELSYDTAIFDLHIRRQPGFLVAITVVPAIVFLTLVGASFWMGSQVESRIMLNLSVAAGHLIFLDYSWFTIPANGDVLPVAILLFRDGLVLAVIGILTPVIRYSILSSKRQPPAWVKSLVALNVANRFLQICSNVSSEYEATIIDESEKRRANAWMKLIILLDRIMFLAWLVTFLVLLLGYIP